jgi:hypothetical protein
MPGTMVCVACSQEIGSEHHTVIVEERTSKAGGMKHNVGGYTTEKIPKSIRPRNEGE